MDQKCERIRNREEALSPFSVVSGCVKVIGDRGWSVLPGNPTGITEKEHAVQKQLDPLCPFEVSCPLWRSESLSSQHQDSMSPCESEATQAERPGLVFDSPHGSARFRSGIPRTTPCSSTGTVLSAFCAPLDGPFWTPKDNVLFPSTEIGSMDPTRAAGI